MLNLRFFYLRYIAAIFLLCLILFTACQEPSNNNEPDNSNNEPDNQTGNTWIEFKNLEEFPVTIYSDSARQAVFAEIPATGTKKVSAEPAPMGRAFYPTFILIYPIGTTANINIPYNGPSITAAILADKTNTVSIPKLESIVTNYAYITLINNSSYSLTFNEGSLEQSPLGGGPSIINNGQNASYEIKSGSVSAYSVLRNGSVPVAFPADLTEFKPGIIYVLTYNGTALTLTSRNSILQKIPPDTPQNVRAEGVSSNSVLITWDTVYGATSYRVYRANGSATASYGQVANTTALSWTDTGLSTGGIYYYKVSAVSGVNMASEQSAVVIIIMPPTNVRVTTITATSVTLGWNAISGVGGYNVYRSDNESGIYTKINSAAVSGTTFTDTGLSSGMGYYYKVSAIVADVEGFQSGPVSAATLSSVPANLRVTSVNTTSVNLAWNAVNEASGYNVYRSNSESGTYTKINSAAINGTAFTDNGVTAYTTYYYKISAVVGGVESEMSSFIFVSTGIKVSGSGFIPKLAWLESNATSNNLYVIEIDADENMTPQTLSYSGKTGITIILSGSGTMRTVNLSAQGYLFAVNTDITLILDNNITLNGRNNNNNSLVYINGGTLIMNAGTKITGNSNSSSGSGVYMSGGAFTMNGGEISGNTGSFGGGVYITSGASFTMNDGEISSNTATYSGGGVCISGGNFTMNGGEISGNTASGDGGGVEAYGIFTMNGGKISNNTASGSNSIGGGVDVYNGTFNMKNGEISGNTAHYGGGVYTDYYAGSTYGTFRMGGGVIYGNNAAADLKNTATNGAVLYKYSLSTAQYGTFSGDTFYKSGDLTTTNTTIRVVNGNLLTE